MTGVYVMPFDETAKLYTVESGSYVKADPAGIRVEVFNEGPICHELLDEKDASIGTLVRGPSTPDPTSGAVEVTLGWSESGNDFELELGMPGSVKDVQGCMMEHAYVASEYEIYPGRYPVNVSYAGGGYLTDTLYVTIVTPGEMKVLKIDTNTSGFDPGHVADIDVEYIDNEPVLVLTPTVSSSLVFSTPVESTNGGGGGGGSSGGGSGGSGGGGRYDPPTSKVCSPAMSCGCMPCEYYIIPYVSQGIKGPLSGADIALFDAAGYRTGTPLYSGQTGEGNDLYTAGLLNLPQALIDELDDDGLYILQISGGTDIDRDDDMVVDDVFTQNNATLHAVLTGADLKTLKPKVSVLTEIAYQIVHEAIMNAEETQSIFDTLDDVGARLLSTKIYPQSDGNISHVDILEWLPTIDREILFADYTARILPIIDKLQAKEDIYQNAYDVVYYPDGVLPIIKSTRFDVPENTPVGTVIGQIDILSEGESAITGMTLSGDKNTTFAVNPSGVVTLAQTLDYETKQSYGLYINAENDQGRGVPAALYVYVADVLDAPVITGFSAPVIYSSSPAGTAVGQISFNEGNSSVTAITIGGTDSDYFQVDLNGTITVAKALENYLTKKAYNITVTVSNILGDSRSASIILNISDGHELPVLEAFDVNVTENTPAGSVIGKVGITSEGLSPITSFTLSGSTNFSIDEQGQIAVAENGKLDYETKTSHYFSVTAHNSYGTGKTVTGSVKVNNIPDTPPTVYSTSMQIDENSPIGTSIGNLTLKHGEAAVDAIEISGEGHELFTADPDGTVRVAGDLDYESNISYSLTFSAVSTLGKSNTATLSVGINNVPDVAPTLQTSTVSRHFKEFSIGQTLANLLVDAGDTPVRSVTLQPDSPFGVRVNGELYLASAFTGETNEFNLTAVAVNDFGAGNSVNVAIHVDAQPILSATRLTVDENASAGTAIGKIGIVSEGMVPIESFSADSALFTIDSDGTVRVAQGTELDYETLTGYGLNVTAANRFGNSNTVALNISVNNVPETAPTLQDLNVTIYSDTSTGTLLGNVLVDEGDTPISEFALSESSPFTIDLAGNVRLTGSYLGDGEEVYHLSARAKNAYGWSDASDVNISVVILPVLLSDTDLTVYYYDRMSGTVLKEISIGANGHAIKNVTLTGTGNEDFEIDLNGTLRVASGVTLDAERRQDYALQVEVNGDYTAALNIEVLDRIIATVNTPGSALDVALSPDGTKAFVADGSSGLQIIDITDPVTSYTIGSVDTPYDARSVLLSSNGTKAYVADAYSGLQIIDVTDPVAPYIIGSVNTPGYARNIALSSDSTEVFVADSASGVQIIDVSDPAMPSLISSVDSLNYVYDVTMSPDGLSAYVADSGRLQLIDVADPLAVFGLGPVSAYGSVYSVALSSDGKTAYVADGYTDLRILDISDPSEALLFGSTATQVNGITLSSDDTKAYAAARDIGLNIIDVTDPTAPTILKSIDTKGDVKNTALSSDETKAYVADGDSGLQIIDIQGLEIPEKVPGIIGFSNIMEADSVVGTFAGNVQTVYTGSEGITGFRLTGDGVEDFDMDTDGNVTLKNRLDYATRNLYNLQAVATNSVGDRTADVTIRIHAVPELEDFYATVYDTATEGAFIGQIDMWVDDNTTITDISLTGEGAENFRLDTNGNIYVTADPQLSNLTGQEFDLTAIATNRYGSGNAANVRILVTEEETPR